MKAIKYISLTILPLVLISCSPNKELVSLDEYDDLYYRGDKDSPRTVSASTSSDVQIYDDATPAEASYYNNEPYENFDNPPVEQYSDEDYYDADYAGGQNNNFYNNNFYNSQNMGMGGMGYGLGPQMSFGMGYGNMMGMYGRPMWGFGMSYGSPWMNTWGFYDPFYDPWYNPYYGWGRPMWGRPMWGNPWYGGGFGYGYPYYGGGFYGGGGFYSGGGFSDGGSTTTYGRRGDSGGRGQRGGITNTGRTSDGTPLLDPTKSRSSERTSRDGSKALTPENRTRLDQTGATRGNTTPTRGSEIQPGDRINTQAPIRTNQRATPPAPRSQQRNVNAAPGGRSPQGISPYGRQQQQQQATGVSPQQRSQPRMQPNRGSSPQQPSMNRSNPTRSSSPSFGGSSPSRSGGGVSPSSPSRGGGGSGGSAPSRGGGGRR